MRRPRAATPLVFAFAAIALVPANAWAQDRRTEALARDAMKKAQLDYELHAYDSAIARLTKAARACAPIRCRDVTRAALARDLGVMHFRKGAQSAAHDAFAEAISLDPKTEIDPNDVTPDLTAAFQAVRDERSPTTEAPPPGDFVHTPAHAQAVNTALPIYVEYTGITPLAEVVVKYKNAAGGEFKKLALAKRDPRGQAWAGLIPCGDVVRGVVRYYVQGFDSSGVPVALSGDPKRMFAVPIRDSIDEEAPRIPGMEPPTQCKESGACAAGAPGCDAIAPSPEPIAPTAGEAGTKRFARVWIGVSGSFDVTFLPSGTDVCKVAPSGAPANSANYYCTNPNGSDFPSRTTAAENDSLAFGNGGRANGGAVLGDVRVALSLDYALNANTLIGARAGYVANTYPGHAAINDGRTFAPPLHFEGRATYLFGDEPLAHVGFAPMAFAAFAVSRFDAATTVAVTRSDVVGVLPMRAWRTTGPWCAVVGGGFRYAFSSRMGFSAAIKAMEAFGGGGAATIISPEIAAQYGF